MDLGTNLTFLNQDSSIPWAAAFYNLPPLLPFQPSSNYLAALYSCYYLFPYSTQFTTASPFPSQDSNSDGGVQVCSISSWVQYILNWTGLRQGDFFICGSSASPSAFPTPHLRLIHALRRWRWPDHQEAYQHTLVQSGSKWHRAQSNAYEVSIRR